MAGFEPAASCSQSRRANQAAPHPVEPNVAYRLGTPGRLPLASEMAQRRGGRTPRRFGGDVPSRYAGGCQPGGCTRSTRRACGRSSMAELQPSKLVMRVRFPSPAPSHKGQVRTGSTASWGPCWLANGCLSCPSFPSPAASALCIPVTDGIAEIGPDSPGQGLVTQDPLAVGEGLLGQRDRLAQPPRRLECAHVPTSHSGPMLQGNLGTSLRHALPFHTDPNAATQSPILN
jgi:hypothetical protein